ncbi:hypothetical protein J4573_12205 [Actinomadura barringtoniae]|uniref:DUF916 domain-containing protein n=1 Tax=Actinomadura barringtoniae TaxID=1427535 RepID=A0A939P9B3_9ACTN|nr:hypothetical protein [Actinomadura barringtoniae]MBO2447857.1 hypothetical protein [Actinomadura barringtoniae]
MALVSGIAAGATVLALTMPGADPVPPPVPAPAAGNGSWSVGPADRGGAPVARPSFAIEAPAGSTVRDAVHIANLTAKPLTFEVYAADAYNTPRDAGFALRGAAEPRRDVGGWIKLPSGRLTVPPGSARDLPFSVTVPANATPGEHIGGIVALNTAIESVQNAGGARIGLRRAVGARVYLRVPGPLTPSLRPQGLTVTRHEPAVPFTAKAPGSLRFNVVNTGNLRLAPIVRVRATGLFGRTLKDWPIRQLPEILPGQSTEITLPWEGTPPLDSVTVRVELTAPGGVKARTHAHFVAIPWAALLTLLGIVFVLWSVLPRIIRRWRIRAGLLPEGETDYLDPSYADPSTEGEAIR